MGRHRTSKWYSPEVRPRAERLAAAGIGPSVGSVGDGYNNALAETINSSHRPSDPEPGAAPRPAGA